MVKKEEGRIKNLDKKIYTMCFSKPRYSGEIKEAFYSEDVSKYSSVDSVVSRLLPKMVNKNELLHLTITKGKKNHDGSIPIILAHKKIPFTYKSLLPAQQQMKRKYYLSSIEPLLNEIIRVLSEKKVKITDEEIKIIKEILDSMEYRKAIGYVFETRVKNYKEDLNPFDLIVSSFCNTASAIFALNAINTSYGKTKKDLLKNWKVLTESFIRKNSQKNELFKISLKNMGENISSVIENKDLARLFIEKTNPDLLQKIMAIDPSCQYNANFIIMGAAIHQRR